MPRKKKPSIDVQRFLESARVTTRLMEFREHDAIFSQGESATSVVYIQKGNVRLSVVSAKGKEAIVATLGAGDFFGEGCLAGQSHRMASATAMTPTRVLIVDKNEMLRTLHEQTELSALFISYVLARNIRIEEDLIDHLFNSSEKRLARALLLLARYGRDDTTDKILPKVSQEVLAEMIGTTRSRVNSFMNKFRRMGLIEYNGELRINKSLLSVVLHD